MALNISFFQFVILLLFVEFSTVSCDTFYIVTSPSSPCPGEYIGVPCLTLQQYASNPSRSQNITFLIEPGMYNLSTVLTVSDGYNFTMSSTNATVTCTSVTANCLILTELRIILYTSVESPFKDVEMELQYK
jgi:hypothetical protein